MKKEITNVAYGHHNIVIGDNQQIAPDECFTLALGDFRYKMTPEEYETINKAIRIALRIN